MRKFTIPIAIVTGLIAPSALAADMGVPPAPPPAPVWNWTGWYAGVNAGASFGRAKTDFNSAPFTVTNALGVSATFPGFAGSDTGDPSGFMGGGQIGYNWQYSPLIVVGLEADFQGALERDSINLSHPFDVLSTNLANVAIGTAVTDFTTKIDWFGTVRGRIGYVWGNGNVMSYLTGGLAYGKVDLEGTNAVSGTINGVLPFSFSRAIGHSEVNTGWVVGYGTEGRLGASNWTWKVEGLYMDLGTVDTTGVTSGVSFGPCPLCGAGTAPFTGTGGQVSAHTRFTDGILRGGLNYKFY